MPVAVERLHEVAAFLAEAHPKDLLLEELGEVFRLHGLFRLALIPHYLLIIKRPTVICSYLLIPPQLSEIGRFYGGGRFYLLARVRSALSPFYSSPRQKSISHKIMPRKWIYTIFNVAVVSHIGCWSINAS